MVPTNQRERLRYGLLKKSLITVERKANYFKIFHTYLLKKQSKESARANKSKMHISGYSRLRNFFMERK